MPVPLPKIEIEIDHFEHRCPDWGGTPNPEAEAFRIWIEDAITQISPAAIPDMKVWPGIQPNMPARIEVFLCTRDTMDALDERDRVLGLFIVGTPDGDPFDDGTPFARAMRVAVVVDREEIIARLRREMNLDAHDPERYLAEYEEGELATIFHEIAHATLFIANSGLISPNSVNLLSDSGELDNDIFDMITGYGIRALENRDGILTWAETTDEASYLMEEWVERQGRIWAREVMAKQSVSMFAALEIDVARLVAEASGEPTAP